jgi:hypothetical protein
MKNEPFNNYLVARNELFSYNYANMLLFLIKEDFFNKTLSSIGTKDSNFTPRLIALLFSCIKYAFPYLHLDLVKTVAVSINRNIRKYLDNINEENLISFNKEDLDTIVQVCKLAFSCLYKDKAEVNLQLEQIYCLYSVRTLRLNSVQKKIISLKSLEDLFRLASNQSIKKLVSKINKF